MADAGDFEPAQPADPELLGVTAARGVGILVGRTLGLQVLTAGVTIVLARLLTPADYGLFAIALATQLVGQRAAEMGLPSALVRMEEEPSPKLQAAVLGITLALATIIAGLLLVVAFVVLPAGGGGNKTMDVVAVTSIAMPLYAARAMPVMLMERRLRFGGVAAVETADTLAFNAFALLAAIAGLGAFSLAWAVPAGGTAGLVSAWLIQRSLQRPTLAFRLVRQHAGFGLRVSALQGIHLLKELGLVVLLSAIGGASVAGFYAMAKRLFSFPIALTTAVARVSFPALSRDPELRPMRAARIATTTALAAGLPLALVAGAAQPLIQLLLGEEWLPTTDIVLIGSLGMMLTASALSTMNSYSLAIGKPNGPIASAVVETAILCFLAVVLVRSMGEAGVGIAIAVSGIGATVVLAAVTHPRIRRSLLTVAKSTAIAVAATALAQGMDVGNDLQGLLLSLLAVAVTWSVLETVLSWRELREFGGVVRPILGRIKGR